MLESFKVSKQSTEISWVIASSYCIINYDLFASEIEKGISILQAIPWVADASKEVSVETIKSPFAKCVLLNKQVKMKMK